MLHPETRAKLDQHITAAYAVRYRTIMGGVFEITPHWMRGFSGLSLSTFNIFRPLTKEGLDDDLLADTAAFFSSQETLYSIELIHDRFPEGPDYLDRRRYQPLPPQPAMVLENLPVQNNDLKLNPDVTIERVHSIAALTAFCDLLHQVFDFSLEDVVKLYPVAHLEKEARNIIRHYLAFVDGQPVSAGTSICLDNVVSVWHVCTLDSHRRKGVATTLMHRMLNEAAESNCHQAMLYATPQAFHFFNKMDFDIYTQRQWFLPPGLQYIDN